MVCANKVYLCLVLTTLYAVTLQVEAQVLGPDFGAYSTVNMGSIPNVPPRYGGIEFLYNDPNILLIGGEANQANGNIYQIQLNRDPVNNNIIGFNGAGSLYSDAGDPVGSSIDGGLDYGPNNVLFFATWPGNHVGQVVPGDLQVTKVIDFGALPNGNQGSSSSANQFVPCGFAGAGKLKISTWPVGVWFDCDVTEDGNGTYDITVNYSFPLGQDVEGFIYIKAGAPGFLVDSVLIGSYSEGVVYVYEINQNGDPILATKRVFISGIGNYEGAVLDPLTGDFLFVDWGGNNSLIIVRGFPLQVFETEIANDQAICPGQTPNEIIETVTVGDANTGRSHQWQESIDGINFTDINGANTTNYTPTSITQDTWYRKSYTLGEEGVLLCNNEIFTNAVLITVNGVFAGSIGNDQQVVAGQPAAEITEITAATETLDYQWQQSTDGIVYNNITGATGITYDPGVLTQDTWFKRLGNLQDCLGESNTVLIRLVCEAPDLATEIFNCLNQTTPNAVEVSVLGEYYDNFEFTWDNNTPLDTSDDVLLQEGSNPLYIETSAMERRIIVTVSNNEGCQEVAEVLLPDRVLLQVTSSATQQLCEGDQNASITLAIQGGSPPYATSIETTTMAGTPFAQDKLIYENLDGGETYTILIRDASGCIVELPITLDTPVNLAAIPDVVYTCVDRNTTPQNQVRVVLEDSTVLGDVVFTLDGDTATSSATPEFTNLALGAHSISITHANGCANGIVTFIIEEIAPLTIIPNTEVINTVTVDAIGGTGEYVYQFQDQEFGKENIFEILDSGTYRLSVMDSLGCISSQEVFVERCEDLSASVLVSYFCDVGSADATNRVQIQMNDTAVLGDIIFSLDADINSNTTTPEFNNVSEGNHTISIFSANGCSVETFAFVIASFSPLEISLNTQTLNTISATANGGAGDYQYRFYESSEFSSTSILEIRESGLYTVTVKDSNGCLASEKLYLEYLPILVPNFFTPNNDGVNDGWKPTNLNQYPLAITKIYDRFGRHIKSLDYEQKWYGDYQNENLPSGDYWYIIEIGEELKGVAPLLYGNFTLYR